MKIAIIHNQYRQGGGMERYLFTLLDGFVDQGDQVDVHVYKYDRRTPVKPGVRVLPYETSWYLPRRARKFQQLRRWNQRFDPSQYDLTLCLTRTTAADMAICGGVHPALVEQTRVRQWRDYFHNRLEEKYEAEMLQQTPIIVAHSQQVAREIHQYYPTVPMNKVHVCYPPIDTNEFNLGARAQRQAVQKKYRLNPNHHNTLLVSMGHQRKGFKETLEAYEHLNQHYHGQYHLYLAGRPPPSLTLLPDNVHCLGYVSKIAELYTAVDVTLLPSHYEAFGLVVTESLACGTPVIITKAVGAGELLCSEEAIIMKNNAPETLVAAIKQSRDYPFKLSPDFVQQHQLTVNQHINRLKQLSGLV